MGVSFPWFPGVSGHGGTSSPGKCVCYCRLCGLGLWGPWGWELCWCGLGLVSLWSLGTLGVRVVLVRVEVGFPEVSGIPGDENIVGMGER